MASSITPDMTVEFAGLRLKNPVIAAAGTFGYGVEFADLLDLGELGALVTKGLSRQPMAGNPAPRLAETPAGLLNSVGLQNIGVEAFIREKLPRLRTCGTVVIANVFGEATEDYIEVVSRLEAAEGVAAYELNLSCPNTARGGMIFGCNQDLIHEVAAAVKKISRRPVLVKLTPNTADITPLAQAAEGAGADALSLINTLIGMQLPASGRSLPRNSGGLSGPAIHPLAVRIVRQAVCAVNIPVIGIGGVICGADAAEFLRAGAVAVEVGTASFYDPRATVRVAHELQEYCARRGLRSVTDLRTSQNNR
ncbi:MAG: dihydroorotate dehydrogenase [Acidobacteria bacterium]|nr:dihydroorotate dehydrogenase [Acidobacteriota bacterium]